MIAVTCARGVELLMDYLEGVLAQDVSAALETHVAGCPRCLAFVESYRATPRLLRDATAETMPAGLARSLHEFLAAHAKRES